MTDRLVLVLPDWARGLLVIGDAHGQSRLFEAAVDRAAAERRFVLSLGDLVDRGPDSAGAIRVMLDLLGRGVGRFVRGNHDDKLRRTLLGNPTTIDGDLAATLAQLDAAPDSKALREGFVAACGAAPGLVQLGATVMVHGAFAPAMLASRTFPPRLRALALYGEALQHEGGGKPVRTYRWVAGIPAGMTVIIGHHPLSDTSIMVRENGQGGRLVHLDCGAGKGRGLGALRLGRDGRIEDALHLALDGEAVRIRPAPLAPVGVFAGEDG